MNLSANQGEGKRARSFSHETGRKVASAAGVAVAVAVLLILCTSAAHPARAQVESVLHSFGTSYGDGTTPFSSLLRDSTGNLYGTTYEGGSSQNGTVFELVYDSSTNSFTEKVLYNFAGGAGDGAEPDAGLTMDSADNLYGTTFSGGSAGKGTVFELNPPSTSGGSYTEKVLYNFAGGTGDGANPQAPLMMDSAGNLYGTTFDGGPSGDGTVFELSPDSSSSTGYSEKVLYIFNNPADGTQPEAGLVMDSAGNLYGTTLDGGSSGSGTVFELSPPATSGGNWTEKVLYSFVGGLVGSSAGLIMDSSGNLYGTTIGGGPSDDGTVFELVYNSATKSYTEKGLYAFVGGTGDGMYPSAGLTMDSAGNLYGATRLGGSSNQGTVFELVYDSSTNSYTEKLVKSFTGSDGLSPVEALIMDSVGNLYGTTPSGGSSYVSANYTSDGTVFGIAPVKRSASSLSFGSVEVGSTSAAQTVTLSNIGFGSLSYGTPSISGTDAGDFAIASNGCTSALAANGTCSVSVTFMPGTGGSKVASLNLTENGLTQTVSLTGTGIYPVASFSSTSLNFPSQDVGATSSAQTVTLTNSSAVPLTVTSVGITGDFAMASNNCSTVAANGTCTVGVTFKPTAGGKRTGTLSFTDNASNSPQAVALSGEGADFALSPRSVDETVSPGGHSTFDLLLSPEGGFNQAVSLACSGAPKGAACTVNPTSVTLDGINSASFGVKVTTTGSAMLAPGLRNFTPPSGSLPLAAWLALFGLLGLLALAKFSPQGGRIRRLAPLATLALLMTFAVACGGGSSSASGTTTSSNSTPAGTYTLTVTGTSGSLTQTAQVTLKVQ